MRIDIKTPRQETKETLKMLIKNYHTIHPEKGYLELIPKSCTLMVDLITL